MTDAHTETKAPVRYFMNERRGLCEVSNVAGIDWRDAGTDHDVGGAQRDGVTQR